MRGNDTYTNFVKGNSGVDQIADSRGKDKLLLTNYSQFGTSALDVNKNGKADSLGIYLDPKGKPIKNGVIILGYFDWRR